MFTSFGVEVPRTDCTHGGFRRIGQVVVHGKLKWYMSDACAVCGHIEMDGDGIPPEDMRRLLMEEHGLWRVTAPLGDKVSALALVRRLLPVSIATAAEHFPLLYVGTKAEAEWVRLCALDAGLETDVSTATPTDLPA